MTQNKTFASRRQHIKQWGQLSALSLLSGLGLSSTASRAQTAAWPQKAIHIIVPNPAGGSADLLPRLISEALSLKVSQPVVVENRPGAAGNIAAEWFSNVEPDGYTLFAAPPPSLSINVSLYPKINYDPAKFVPITILATVSNALLVHPSIAANSLQELIAFAKANPEKLAYASQGNGSTSHLTAELFKQKTGAPMVHVPYKGDAPAIADLLAGHVQIMFGNIAAASSHLKTGKLKLLAVTSAKRLSGFPNVPSISETIPGFVSVTWFGVVAPPKTPLALAQKISKVFTDILRTPEMMKKYAEVGADVVANTPEELAQWMKEDTERWRSVIKTGNVTID
jgi:tripartite-type tricarboxylate transporter receptor subunit TctC